MEKIPYVFHNMWLDKKDSSSNDYPKKYKKYMDNKEKLHPEFLHKVWSYDDVLKVISTDPELGKYKSLLEDMDMWICKCDLARLLVLYKYGGVYADLDINYKKNIKKLLENKSEYFIYEPQEHMDDYGKKLIWNGFFAVSPKHPFIKELIEYINTHYDNNLDHWKDVINMTGPRAMANVYEENNHSFPVENSCSISPLTKFGGKYSKQCKKGDEYATTKWNDGTNWALDVKIKKLRKQLPYILLGVLIVFIIFAIIRMKTN